MSYCSHINVQLINDYGTKIYDHNLFLQDFREKKIEFLEIGPFRKLAKTFFLSKISIRFFTQIFLI